MFVGAAVKLGISSVNVNREHVDREHRQQQELRELSLVVVEGWTRHSSTYI
jgi:hypothetical protein